jgi:urea transporter
MQFQPRSFWLSRRYTIPLPLQELLSSVGQIYFQSSPIFGIALLLCLYLSGPALALGCVAGACVASGTAWVLAFPDDARRRGIYSFNGALSGAGLAALYQFNSALIAWIALAGVVTALLSRAAQRIGLPVLTSLFVLVMWLTAAAAPQIGLQALALTVPPAAPAQGLAIQLFEPIANIAFARGGALGALLCVVLAGCDWRQAAWLLAGAVAGSVTGFATGSALGQVAPVTAVVAASAGVNCALTLLGLCVHGRSWPWRVGGGVVCIVICMAFVAAGIAAFTAPFVLTTWLVLWWSGPPHIHPAPRPAP